MPNPQLTPQNFFDQPGLGSIAKYLLMVMGMIVVVMALFRIIKHVSSGQMGSAVKVGIGSLVLAAFMLFPGQLIYPSISAVSSLVSGAITTVNGASSTTGSTTVTVPPAPTTTAGG